MFFAIMATDIADSLPKRLAARPDHLARLQALQDAGRLLVAGPHPAIETVDPGPAGFTGSLIIAEFPSAADAQAWAEKDPYVDAGVYADVTIKPFKPVFPA
ncbi:YciI family protein [Halopseudomonas sp.]|uniref:YciI family protein n=1 Tax=Halopseudomonas sp. TaxID=2901191 RepID=UPI0039E52237